MAIHVNNANATISATTTSARVAYPDSNTQFVRVFVDGTTTAVLKTGDSTVTATLNGGTPIGGGKSAVLAKGINDTHLAAIMASGTATVWVQAVSSDEQVGF